jgi:pilus assembly protein CpaD
MNKSVLFLLPLATLGACGGATNRGLESVHQPVVGRADFALDLAAGDGGLADGEVQRLDGWLRTVRVGFGDRIAIDESGGRMPAAAGEVAGVVARYGLLLADEAPVTAAPVAPGTVRVVISRMRAEVPGCSDWSRDLANEFEGNTHSNFGCAINTNLAAMVANPSDLVRGADGAVTSDPASAFKAIENYRKGPATGAGQALKTETAGGR